MRQCFSDVITRKRRRSPSMITACTVDEDTGARQTLRSLLQDQEVTILGETDSGRKVVPLVKEHHPDLLLIETQLPGLSGVQVADALQALDAPPLLVFVTSFVEHSLAAFACGALDYLLKPVSPERLAKALQRAGERLAERHAYWKAQQESAEQTRPSRRLLSIHEPYKVTLIPIEEI